MVPTATGLSLARAQAHVEIIFLAHHHFHYYLTTATATATAMPSSSLSSRNSGGRSRHKHDDDDDDVIIFPSSSSYHHHDDDKDNDYDDDDNDCEVVFTNYDATNPPVELDMSGHDITLLGPKLVVLDSFVVDLLNVDTSAQTFKLKLILNMDWEDHGIIEPEYKAKRNLGRTVSQKAATASRRGSMDSNYSINTTNTNNTDDAAATSNNNTNAGIYRTGKYVLKHDYRDDPLSTTWNPEVVLMNGIADESPIEAGSNFHSVQMLAGRPVISRSVLYQPECRCAFSFSNFPFDETDLVVKFGSNKWSSEQVKFIWSQRLEEMQQQQGSRRKEKRSTALRNKSILCRGVDANAIGGVGLSEFEIIEVRVESDEVDVNSLLKYDNADGAFSHAHLIIRVRRDPYSYLLRVSSVAELLMFLEVLSFLAHSDDLAARFSISGTIFLAMVSLYGPMADALPKVSVVTRVDRW